jgi:La-related protein 7
MEAVGAQRPVRRTRCRIKGLVKSVSEQLEFYFSEPNLRRDQSFRKLAGGSGMRPVAIAQFVRYNKINQLTQDVQILRRAAFESKVLKLCDLSEPFDQGAVCRIDPVPPTPRDIRAKTVYIEGLPRDATVQWLQDLITAVTHCKPLYICLPRQKSGFSRGFAFVEFNSYSLAENTVKDFNSKKAIATAFLLQSSRRKLFQQWMRQRHMRALDAGEVKPLPPPVVRFLPEDERNKRLSHKPKPPVSNESKPPITSEKEPARNERKRHRESEGNGRDKETESSSKRKRRETNEKRKPELELDEDSGMKKRQKVQRVMENGDGKAKRVSKSPTPGLWMRTRRNSFPPLGGCLSRHGLGYWSTCVLTPTVISCC